MRTKHMRSFAAKPTSPTGRRAYFDVCTMHYQLSRIELTLTGLDDPKMCWYMQVAINELSSDYKTCMT